MQWNESIKNRGGKEQSRVEVRRIEKDKRETGVTVPDTAFYIRG
jgi:hypothetical protein